MVVKSLIGLEYGFTLGKLYGVIKKGKYLYTVKDDEGETRHMNQNYFEEVEDDVVNHPKHYSDHPSGVECIEITQHMDFCVGNAMKYLWRGGKKDDNIQDLKKAIWYIERKIKLLEGK